MVHIHAEGPAFFAWLPKMFGKRVVVTVHGLDWAREKWKFGVGSKFIRQGEKNAVKYMIGDGENDIKAGLAARCKSILVNGNGTDTKNEDFGQIDTLASVLEFVDKYLC